MKRRERRIDANGETHTEGMRGEGEGAQAWDSGISQSKGPGRLAGNVGGVRRSDETKDVLGRGRSPCRNKEEERRKRDDGQRICLAAARKNDAHQKNHFRPYRYGKP